MLRLKDVPPDEMREVVRVATELYREDQTAQEKDQERQHLIEAAGEVGLPEEYLERAAAEVHRRRVAEIQVRLRKKRIGFGLAAALGLAGVVVLMPSALKTTPAPLAPPTVVQLEPQLVDDFTTAPETRWELKTNSGTNASIQFTQEAARGGVAKLQVRRFSRGTDGKYFANFDTTQGQLGNLAGREAITFAVRGQGLAQVRVYLENGPTERWRSPAVAVPNGWDTRTVRIDQLEYQTRRTSAEPWRVERFRPPQEVRRLSFKLGDFVNPVEASGEVALDDVRVE